MVSARIAEAFSNGSINTTAYPYITPEYLSETRDPQAIGAIIFLLCFTAIVLLLRVFSRVFLVKSFGLDDGLAIFGFVRPPLAPLGESPLPDFSFLSY